MLRSDSGLCKAYHYPDSGRAVLANMSPTEFLLLREPSNQEMDNLWSMYEREYLVYLHGYLTSTYGELPATKSRQPNTVVGATYYAYPHFLRTEGRSCELQASGDRLMEMSIEEQRAWVREVIGTTWADMRSAARKTLHGWLPPTKEELLDGDSWVPALDRAIAKFVSGRKQPNPQGPVPIAFFLCLLHREGFLLFPAKSIWSQSINAFPLEAWLTPARYNLFEATLSALEDLTSSYGAGRSVSRLSVVLRGMLLRSTISKIDDVHREFSMDFHDYNSESKTTGQTYVIRTLTYKILRYWSEQVHGVAKLADEKLVGRDLFHWTRHPRKNNLPRGLENYHPDVTIIAWADAFQSVMGALNHLFMNDHKAAANIWLAYIRSLDDPPRDLTEVVRDRHVNSGAPDGGCFRSYLIGLKLSRNRKVSAVRLLCKMFDLMIAQRNLGIKNPVVYELDKFRPDDHPRRTVRMPLSIDLMSYVREFNRRDDFAFSRSLDVHYCERRDPATGKMKKLWWPGVAVAVHFLLELPLRGFQVRFLDSGEADEEIADIEHLKWVPNRSVHARKGRSKGVLYIEEAWGGDTFLGVYVSTNKTGVGDTRSGYRIPWCPSELAGDIRMLCDWNRANNNVGECPLIEKGNYNDIKNPVVKAAVGTCFPLFRDPITDDGYPLQRRRLEAYWHMLVKAVESEINASPVREGTRPLRLTRLEGNGKDAEWVSLFDIHSLRVSGITNLIERGLPPSMVMEIVGHASVVMTLYYNRTRMENLNARLKEALGKYPSPTAIPDLDIPQIEDLLEYLDNIRPSAQGKDLVREHPEGFGNGAFHIFADGICPGGECSKGGEGPQGGTVPVPRPRACSLCRFRLTGPSFLGGLVYNANRLMYQLRKIGERINGLLIASSEAEEQGRGTGIYEAQVNGLYEEASNIANEWAAEVQYIHHVLDMMDARDEGAGGQLVLLDAGAGEISVAKQEKTDFHLLQELVRSADIVPGFRPDKSIVLDHRELLNDILVQNELDPFLVRLDPRTRDRAAVMLGEVFLSSVPEGEFSGLLAGERRLADFDRDLPDIIASLGQRMVSGNLADRDERAVALGVRPNMEA